MKKIVYALTLWTLIVGLVMVAPTYASAPPADVTITLDMIQGSDFDGKTGTNSGTWAASGAFVDSGAAVEAFRLNFDSAFVGGARFVNAEESLTSSSGTITIQTEFGQCTFVPGPLLVCEGTWAVASGTGAYQGLAGQGTGTVTVNLTLAVNSISLTGFAHLP